MNTDKQKLQHFVTYKFNV